MRKKLATTLKRRVDVETLDTLQRRMSLLEGTGRGEKAIEEGRTMSHTQAKRRMTRWLK
jgi:hypothetical protein